MELGFSDLFTIYEMELELHGHVDIENQLGLTSYDMELAFTSYDMELGYCTV